MRQIPLFSEMTFSELPPPSSSYRTCEALIRRVVRGVHIDRCGSNEPQLDVCGREFTTYNPDSGLSPDGCWECPDCHSRHTCHSCGSHHGSDDMLEVEGEHYCSNCASCCDSCDTPHLSDELRECSNGNGSSYTRTVCEECRWQCADCHNWFFGDSSQNVNGEAICSDCAEHYFTCSGCGEIYPSDDSVHLHGEEYCSSCADDVDCSDDDDDDGDDSGPIRDYGYKPRPVFYGKNEAGLFFGVELEVDDGNDRESAITASGLSGIPAYYCKIDGSLSCSGFEVVSHPATWDTWINRSYNWMEKLRKAKFRSYDTDTCGMHIHVSRDALSNLDVFKLLSFFRNNPEMVLRLSRRKAENLRQWAAIDTDSGLMLKKAKGERCGERYKAINTLPEHTVEFRIFRGTLDRMAFLRNIALIRCLVAYVKETSLQSLTTPGFRLWVQDNAARILGHKEVAGNLVSWVHDTLVTMEMNS